MFAILFGMVGGPSDEELARRFNNGDQGAFSELVRRYQHRVFSMCLRWLGNPTLAEEVAQDVFMSLYKALGSFRGDARLSTWIYRVTVNHCKNRKTYRQRRRMDRHEPLEGDRRDEDAPKRQLADAGPGADAGAHRAEAEQLLQEALTAMDEEQRQIIVLRDIQDLSYDEIADILQVPKGTVKSRLHRARGELARKLGRRISVADVV